MRIARFSAIALLIAASAAAFAASGIEVLRTTATPDGIEVLSASTEAPLGSYVEAVMEINGMHLVVSVCPVNPLTGHALNIFPTAAAGNHIDLRGPGGELLASAPGGGLAGGVDFD